MTGIRRMREISRELDAAIRR
jgi:hypothetical protein